jgi:hypothetical protein
MLKVTHETEEGAELVIVARRRRRLHRIVAAIVIAICVIGVAMGGLFWRLSTGSISLGFLSDRVEAALKERLPAGTQVNVGSTAIAYRSGQGVVLRLKGIELLLPGTAAVSADELVTSTTPAILFGGRIGLNSVTVSGLSIGVAGLPLIAHQGSGADLVRQAATALSGQVSKADTIMRAAGLQTVTIKDAAIHLDDKESFVGPGLTVDSAEWEPLGSDRSKASVHVVDGDGKGWAFSVDRRIGHDSGSSVSLDVDNLPVASFLPQLAGNTEGPRLHAAVTLQMRVEESAAGAFSGLRGVISTGAGEFSMDGKDEVQIQSTALSFALAPAGNRLEVPSAEVRTQSGRLLFEGVADISDFDNVTLVSRVRGGSLPTPIGMAKSVEVVGGGGMARLNLSDIGISVDRFDIVTPSGSASIIGQASVAGATPGVSFALSLTEMPAATARALWPPFVADKTRGWFDLNVKDGMLGPATLSVALPPENIGPKNRGKVLPNTALVGTVPFHDASFSPIPTFPTIKSALGGITFGNATASIWAQTGIISVKGKGDVQAGGTTLIIPELGRTQPRGDLHLELAGSAPALAQLSNTPPLHVAGKYGVDPDSISGKATLSLDANIPIYDSDFADVIPTFRLTLDDFTSTKPIEGRSVEKADLVLEGNPKSYTVKGLGKLDGFDASVDLILGAAAPDTSAVSVELDAAARKRLGIDLGGILTGPVVASLTHTDQPRQQVALDLKQARLDLAFLGWEKGPGVPATASFEMEKTDAGTEISNFLLSGKGFQARGALSIGPDGHVKSMDFDRITLRAGDDVAATVRANGGGYDVKVKGASLDVRGILGSMSKGMGSAGSDVFPLRVTLDLDLVKGQNNVTLANVSGQMTLTAKGLDTVSLKGLTDDNQPFEWTIGHEGKTRTMRLFADGGGALIRFSGIYSRVAGGNLIIDYSGPIGGTGAGVAMLRDFRLLNETALADAVQTAAPRRPGDPEVATVPRTDDISFAELKIPFRQQDWVININDAALRGAILGATASGTINVRGGKMAISGTFIPVFGLNNIAGAIPIIGAILGGGRNEGLVGITYKMFGPLDNPQLVMNPISAIAPGIFRKIFEYR